VGCRYARLVLERGENSKRRACRELRITYHTLIAYLRFRPGVDEEAVIEEGPEGEKGESDGASSPTSPRQQLQCGVTFPVKRQRV
jgi:hypothetical protein